MDSIEKKKKLDFKNLDEVTAINSNNNQIKDNKNFTTNSTSSLVEEIDNFEIEELTKSSKDSQNKKQLVVEPLNSFEN